MARSILALALLGMLVFASAERSLLANRVKYSSGSAEAIALTTPFSLGGTAATPANSPWAQDLGYFITTGNGTWSQAAANPTYAYANLAPFATVAGASTISSTPNYGLFASRAFQGLQSVAFPSKMLGIAVGQNNAGMSSLVASTTTLGAAASPNAVLAASPQQNGNVLGPNIIFTTDVATTWQAVTAFGPTPAGSCGPQTTGCSTATLTSFPSAQTYLSQTVAPASASSGSGAIAIGQIAATGAGLGGVTQYVQGSAGNGVAISTFALFTAAVTGVTARTPYALAPDFQAVTCTSRVACFAVGGYSVGVFTTVAANPAPALADPGGYTYGQILTSTNGGTMWNYASIPASIPSSFCSSTALTSGMQCPVPGLTDIDADSSGRHLYAVGWTALNGQVWAGDAASAGNVAVTTASNPSTTGTGGYTTPGAGFIMYSGNSGASWVVQSAPILQNTIYVYTAVSVPRGTIAVAAGGQPAFSEIYTAGVTSVVAPGGTGVSGVVSATFNGGFSWLNMPYTGSFINDVACQSTNPMAAYTCFFVGDRYQAFRATFNATTKSNVLLGTQLGANIQPAFAFTSITLPAQTRTSDQNSVTLAASLNPGQIGSHLLGVVFDNPKVGWMFGYTTILRTSNGGASWFSEAPYQIAAMPTTSGGQAVFGLAPVPTSY